MFGRKKKEAPATTDKTAAPAKQSQLAVIKDAYKLVKKESPSGIVISILSFFVVAAIGIGIGIAIDHPIYLGFISLPLAFLVAFFLFTRFANTAAFASIQGQLGAGASVLI
jgi:hypothetical protein